MGGGGQATVAGRTGGKSLEEVKSPISRGTAKQAVSDDYYKHLDGGFKAAESVVNDFLSAAMAKDPTNHPVPTHTMCHTINETVCTVVMSVMSWNTGRRPI